jgi:23S rRNA (uracil747-C5)-methyltransferase
VCLQALIEPTTIQPLIHPAEPWESRYKIKMAVSGTVANPMVGIIRKDLSSTDLCNCPLTPSPIRMLLGHLRATISAHKLTPYDVAARSGELKHIIVMANTEMTEAILRFVVRSSEAVPRIRKAMGEIQSRFPWVTVVSCNIQPLPAAILEGEEEIVLTDETHIKQHFGRIPLYFAPQSFMQVTPTIAAQLYTSVAKYVAQHRFSSALDLFCGVGGFSLHIAPYVKHVTGVELSAAAIESAQKSAHEALIHNASFITADVEGFLASNANLQPDLVVVNPPRRGLSAAIRQRLAEIAPRVVMYSSCNPETFARDVQDLSGAYQLLQVQPFDMFPMTDHCEVLGVLNRID